jgi:hypothetical protein
MATVLATGSRLAGSNPNECDGFFRLIQEVLGRTNLPTFSTAMVAIVTLVKD